MSSSQPSLQEPGVPRVRLSPALPLAEAPAGFTCLPSPDALRRELPVPPSVDGLIRATRSQISALLRDGEDPRLLVIAGPCSLHDRESALEYAHRLAAAAHWHRRELLVVMRSYVEKPRSGAGWKGFLNDPDLDGRCDAASGLTRSRELLLEIGRLGLPCASELLDPIATHYLDDLLAWAAIGARTVASQPHRELASGLGLPVGVKNAVNGDVESAVQGALAARAPHTLLGIDAGGRAGALRTRGNPDTHVVLRGGEDGANHEADAVVDAAVRARPLGLARPLLVDCSHANSGKDHQRQGAACRSVLRQVAEGRKEIAGLLLESHLREGRQDLVAGRRPDPDQSITDACIGWEETAELLEEAARAARAGLQ